MSENKNEIHTLTNMALSVEPNIVEEQKFSKSNKIIDGTTKSPLKDSLKDEEN